MIIKREKSSGVTAASLMEMEKLKSRGPNELTEHLDIYATFPECQFMGLILANIFLGNINCKIYYVQFKFSLKRSFSDY